jgi:hypothetical protein
MIRPALNFVEKFDFGLPLYILSASTDFDKSLYLWRYGRIWYVILSCFRQIQKVALVCYYKTYITTFANTHNPLFFTNSDISTYATLKNSI